MDEKEWQQEEGATDGMCQSIFSRTAVPDWDLAKTDLFSV